jgi:hypothetical protein
MADTRSLSFIGLMVGAFVVTGHVTGHAHFEDGLSIISTPAATR